MSQGFRVERLILISILCFSLRVLGCGTMLALSVRRLGTKGTDTLDVTLIEGIGVGAERQTHVGRKGRRCLVPVDHRHTARGCRPNFFL